MLDTLTMQIQGTDQFTSQCKAAIDRLLPCKDATAIVSSIVTIQQIPGGFAARADADRNIYISEHVAFWPGQTAAYQQDILATYIAHEGVHTFLRQMNSEYWNTIEGEKMAIQYQSAVANCLAVPQAYVLCPESTVAGGLGQHSAMKLAGIGLITAGIIYLATRRK